MIDKQSATTGFGGGDRAQGMRETNGVHSAFCIFIFDLDALDSAPYCWKVPEKMGYTCSTGRGEGPSVSRPNRESPPLRNRTGDSKRLPLEVKE